MTDPLFIIAVLFGAFAIVGYLFGWPGGNGDWNGKD